MEPTSTTTAPKPTTTIGMNILLNSTSSITKSPMVNLMASSSTLKPNLLAYKIAKSKLTSANTFNQLGSTDTTTKSVSTSITPSRIERDQVNVQTALEFQEKQMSELMTKQISSNLNARLIYATRNLQNDTYNNFVYLFKQICELDKLRVDVIKAFIQINPTLGLRLWTRQPDIVANPVGDAFFVSKCRMVQPIKIFWSHKIGNVCYANTPVLVDNITLFVQSGNDELMIESEVVNCGKVIYKGPDNKWYNNNGTLNVLSLSRPLRFQYSEKLLLFNDPFVFPVNFHEIESPSSVLMKYANRMNQFEKAIKDLSYNLTAPSRKWLLAEIGVDVKSRWEELRNVSTDAWDTIVDKANSTVSWVTEKVTNLKDSIVDGFWSLINFDLFVVKLIFGIGLPILLIIAFCYFAPYILSCVQLIREIRTRPRIRNEINNINVNNIEMQPLRIIHDPPGYLNYFPNINYVNIANAQVLGINATKIYIKLFLNNMSIVGLFDPGAEVTYCGISTIQKAGLKNKPLSLPIIGKTANGSIINFLGQTEAILQIAEKSVNILVYVTNDKHCPAPILIGTDTMIAMKQKITLDFENNEIQFGKTIVSILNTGIIPDIRPIYKVRIPETTVLEARSDNLIFGQIDIDLPEDWQFLCYEDPKIDWNTVVVGKTLVKPIQNRFFAIRVINTGYAPKTLFKGISVAELEYIDGKAINSLESLDPNYISKEVSWHEQLPSFSQENVKKLVPSKLIDLSDCAFDKNGKKKLLNILDKNYQAFVGHDNVIGHYKGKIRHRIDLETNSQPFSQPAYRLPFTQRPEVKKQLEDMLKQNIIRPSTSPFASPIILVPKKDNTWRFAVDYRKLNSITKKQTYFLPRLDDAIDMVSGKKFFSTFDLQSGFWQIDVEPTHRYRTAFITFMGLYEWTRLPFGLSGAPTTFQRVMDGVTRELRDKQDMYRAIFCYLDDVIVASSNQDEHLQDINDFLSVLIKFGLKLKLQKCHFGCREIKFLGFKISEDGIRPDEKNLEVIQKFKPPNSLKELRSFIGCVSYFRRFIPDFASIMVPLYKLTGKDVPFDWAQEQANAFKDVLHRLVTPPVLAPPRFGHPFVVETDASKIGLGCCLLQNGNDGELHPILYASRTTNKHEARYQAVELEALAIVYALQEFRPYLEGSGTSIIRTDSSALCSLLKRKDLTGRLARYQFAIQAYDIRIEHRSGRSNVFCDFISRYVNNVVFPLLPLNENLESQHMDLVTLEQIREEQYKDAQCKNLLEALIEDKWPVDEKSRKQLEEVASKLTVVTNVLYRIPQDSEDLRIVIPYMLREKLINQYHCLPAGGGHMGISKTIARMKIRFYWVGMIKDITEIVRRCSICQSKQLNPSQTFVEPLNPIIKPTKPFIHIHIDILTLPRSIRQNRYLLVCVDSFSKLIVASPIFRHEDEVCRIFHRHFWIQRVKKWG
jgi:hypothetical protein